jgi:hypothetical protein
MQIKKTLHANNLQQLSRKIDELILGGAYKYAQVVYVDPFDDNFMQVLQTKPYVLPEKEQEEKLRELLDAKAQIQDALIDRLAEEIKSGK